MALLIGLRAELPNEKLFHQVLVPFDNSIWVEAIQYIRGCAYIIIKKMTCLVWNRCIFGESGFDGTEWFLG
jgi:hypothetical protein